MACRIRAMSTPSFDRRLLTGLLIVACVSIAATGAGQAPAAPPASQQPDAATAGRGGRGGRGQGPDMNSVPDFSKREPIRGKPPDEQLKDFILQPGYRLELVLSDPVI